MQNYTSLPNQLFALIAQMQQKNLRHTWELIQEKDKSTKFFQDFLLELIDVVELFHLMIQRCESLSGTQGLEAKNFKKVLRKLETLLENSGLTKMEFPDNKASAQLCEILEVEHTDDPALMGTIKNIVKNGYYLNNNVLKYAQVVSFSGLD